MSAGGHVPSFAVDLRERRIAAHWWAAEITQRAWAGVVLRGVTTGRSPVVLGRPTVTATNMVVGDDFKIWSGHRRTLVSGWGRIRMGDRVFVNVGTVIVSVQEVEIGDDVALANEVLLVDSHSHGIEGRPHVQAPIRIGAGSWVGNRAIVLPGVTLGRRVVVGAGAVVTRDVPDDMMVAGNPARVVRQLSYPPGCRRAWHDQWVCPCPKLEAASEPA